MARKSMYHTRDTFPRLIELYDEAIANPKISKREICRLHKFEYITFMGFWQSMKERPTLVKEVGRYKAEQAKARAELPKVSMVPPNTISYNRLYDQLESIRSLLITLILVVLGFAVIVSAAILRALI